MMVFKIADARRGDTPDIAIDAIFAPSRLVCLHRRTGANLPFERIQVRLHLGLDAVQHLHNLATADRDPMQGVQVQLNLSNGQPHHRTQRGNQAGQSHAEASLPNHLLLHVYRGFIPALTSGTPALVDPMVCDLDWRGHGDIDHLAASRQTDAAQTQLTCGTCDQPMLHNLRWLRAWSGAIVPRITLLASLLLFL